MFSFQCHHCTLMCHVVLFLRTFWVVSFILFISCLSPGVPPWRPCKLSVFFYKAQLTTVDCNFLTRFYEWYSIFLCISAGGLVEGQAPQDEVLCVAPFWAVPWLWGAWRWSSEHSNPRRSAICYCGKCGSIEWYLHEEHSSVSKTHCVRVGANKIFLHLVPLSMFLPVLHTSKINWTLSDQSCCYFH